MQGQFSRIRFLISDLKSSRDFHFLKSLGKLFQTLAPTKDTVSMPYVTEWIFFDFILSSFLRAYRHSAISNTSFVTSGAKFIFTLKIFVISFWRFLSWILQELFFSRSSSKCLFSFVLTRTYFSGFTLQRLCINHFNKIADPCSRSVSTVYWCLLVVWVVS